MGLESLLLSISFKKPLKEELIIEIFEEAGASFLKNKSNIDNINDFRHWYFEIRTENGLSEIDILLTPNKNQITSWTLRFSILSPEKVIDQSFNFLRKLKSLRSLKVFDTQLNSKEIELDIEKFKDNQDNERKREIILNNKTGIVIEGGSATTDYIHRNDLVDKIWKLK